MENEPLYTLKKYWGYDNFRNSQEAVIKSVLESNDTFPSTRYDAQRYMYSGLSTDSPDDRPS